jgi:putative transcriptional regulator
MGTLAPEDLSQFVSTPETKKAPVAVESEQSTRVKPSEPGSEPEKKE